MPARALTTRPGRTRPPPPPPPQPILTPKEYWPASEVPPMLGAVGCIVLVTVFAVELRLAPSD